jgi:hypothetical protein
LLEIDSAVLEDQAQVPPPQAGTYSVSVSFLTSAAYVPGLHADLETHRIDAAIVAEDDHPSTVWRVARGDVGPLTDFFDGLGVDADLADALLYPFDRSSEPWEVAPFLANPLVEFASQRVLTFSAWDLASAALGTIWDISFGEAARLQIGATVNHVLVDATKGPPEARALHGYLRRAGRSDGARTRWEIVESRLSERRSNEGFNAAIARYWRYYSREQGLFTDLPEDEAD